MFVREALIYSSGTVPVAGKTCDNNAIATTDLLIMQKSFSDLGYAAKKKLIRRDRFLAKIDSVTPWSKLHALV